MTPIKIQTAAAVINDYFNSGMAIKQIAKKHDISAAAVNVHVSKYLSAYGEAQKVGIKERENEPLMYDTTSTVLHYSEEYLMNCTNEEFYAATNINPNSRYSDCIFF